MKRNHVLFILYTFVLVIVVGAVSASGTFLLLNSQRVRQGDQVTVTKAEYQRMQSYRRLDELRSYISQLFIGEYDDQELLDYAAKGMMVALGDPYSNYFTPEETELFQADAQGEYAGVGCLLTVDPQDSLITITRVYKDSPAQQAGILPGDKIVGVNGEAVSGSQQDYAVSIIRGEPGTTVDIRLYRAGEHIDLTVERQVVHVNRVSTRTLEGNIGLIVIDQFEGDALQGFSEALDTFKKEKAQGIIIDLRGNPGGNLDMVVDMCDLLLPQGVVVSIKDKQGNVEEFTSDAAMSTLPVVVLVNELSASASEIMAGAIQDYELGPIVGTQTFGKGIVQNYYVFKDDNAMVSITAAEYYTPNGRNIHGVGITPDIVVELPEELRSNPFVMDDTNDTQLIAAIEALKEEIAKKAASQGS